MLRRIVSAPWFARADLLLVLLSGCLWMLKSEIGIVPVIAIALIPWVIRLSAGSFPFQRTSLDWLVLLFLGTAWLGYWAAYNQDVAWSKVWFVFFAVLVYYALAGQPVENREWVCTLFFCIGVGVSIYFFLTHDFTVHPRKLEIVNRLGNSVMRLRPRLELPGIHPNYVAGIVALTTPFIFYPVRQSFIRNQSLSLFFRACLVLGGAIAVLAIFMATSRGIIMAVASACGIWLLFKMLDRDHSLPRLRIAFPSLVLVCLSIVVLFLYFGPANSGTISTEYPYGTGSRGELFVRSLSLVLDFPFTGGGLGTFPGLYSYYILGIPFFNVINSHNLFLDIAIEQGILGGLSFLFIFLISIWSVAKNMVRAGSFGVQLLSWLTLSALIIAFVHGMVDDYLYNGSGTMLALALAGLSSGIQSKSAPIAGHKNGRFFIFLSLALILLIAIKFNGLRAAWLANLGAVQMAKVELASFPTNQWTEPEIVQRLEEADLTLRSALQAAPENQTANHRLGLISMLRGDFLSASEYLERARDTAPNHRGIIKSLGYSYVWRGEIDKAMTLLRYIPEATDELDVYIWWWDTQGRHDLSVHASHQLTHLKTQMDQP